MIVCDVPVRVVWRLQINLCGFCLAMGKVCSMGCKDSLADATLSPAVPAGEMLPDPMDVPARPHPVLLLLRKIPSQTPHVVPRDKKEE